MAQISLTDDQFGQLAAAIGFLTWFCCQISDKGTLPPGTNKQLRRSGWDISVEMAGDRLKLVVVAPNVILGRALWLSLEKSAFAGQNYTGRYDRFECTVLHSEG